MRLLITTPHQLLLCDAETGRTQLLRTGDGFYFGVSWGSRGVFLSHNPVDGESLETWRDYRGAVRGCVRLYANGDEAVASPEELLAPHQIECVDDQVVVANTGRNCISVVSFDGSPTRHRFLNDLQWEKNEDGRKGNHFNSVHKVDDTLWVVAHNLDKPSAIWELSWPDLETIRVRETNMEWAHNLWVGDAGLVSCNSKHGSLVETESGETIWSAGEKRVVTRGLAVSSDLLFVGRSEYGLRGERKYNNGGLWIIDRKTLKTIERYVFPGSGCVNDVRMLDAPDECHHGLALRETDLEALRHFTFAGSMGYRLRCSPSLHRIYRGARGAMQKLRSGDDEHARGEPNAPR